MKNLIITATLVIGLMTTSAAFAEGASSDITPISFSAFDGIETHLASDTELNSASGEFFGLLFGALVGAFTYKSYTNSVSNAYRAGVNCTRSRYNVRRGLC